MGRLERAGNVDQAHGGADSQSRPRLVREPGQKLRLRLYIADGAPNSVMAETNLRACLETLPVGSYELEVVDCIQEPARALSDGVIVTPTLLKLAPAPTQIVIGTLTDRHVLANALGFVHE
jgi:circadian clock protein KaiB